MADDAQIFNTRATIPLEQQKLETSNLVCAPTTMSSFDSMQNSNTRSKGTWPSLGDLDLNLQNPANISQRLKLQG